MRPLLTAQRRTATEKVDEVYMQEIAQKPLALQMRGVGKSFPGVKALDDVDFELRAGEVMGLVGENGAGKSTLLKILAGVHQQDEGEISVAGQTVEISDPQDSQRLNVAMIYQELNLAEHLSVAENVFVGREPRTKFGFVDFRAMNRDTRRLFEESLHTTDIDPRVEVRRLSIAQKQLVEIARALSLKADIMVMDEPTSSLSDSEVRVLLEFVCRLRDSGLAVIYVSHRLEEVFEVGDRVTVLRDGQLVGVWSTEETTPDEIVKMMVGRELEDLYGEAAETQSSETGLEVRDLVLSGTSQGISLRVRTGEIVGLSGLMGAGRTELARAVFGADPIDGGTVLVEGEEVPGGSPERAIEAGIGYVPEDRKLQGLFLDMSVRENITAASSRHVGRIGFIRFRDDRRLAEDARGRLKIRAASVEQSVRDLSGGNQQKVVLAKWMAVEPRVLILDEPTRGVDVGGKAEIYALIRQMAQQGMALIVISSELPEVLGVSDRILVMRQGLLVGELSGSEANEEKVMALATGTTRVD